MLSFSSSYFIAVTTASAKNVAPAGAVKAPEKDGSNEETADGTAEADVF